MFIIYFKIVFKYKIENNFNLIFSGKIQQLMMVNDRQSKIEIWLTEFRFVAQFTATKLFYWKR